VSRVVLEGVTKRYDDLVAVDHLDLDIEEGEFVALLGPSGCGKTTTLHMLAGLERPTEGRIFIGEDDVTNLAARRRNIGLIFQDYSVFPHMSPRQNLEFGLRVRKWSRERRREKVREVAGIVELPEDVLERRSGDLSPSELQRVAIARTLVTEPRLVLLDEPLSNLESELRARTRARLKRLFADLGQTTIYVTHDQIEAMALANRIAVMSSGRLQQVGTPEDVYLRPANMFVAGFLGSPPMNFIPGRVEGGEDRFGVVTDGGTLNLVARKDDLGAGDSEVVVGIRPENLVVSQNGSGSASRSGSTLAGSVFAVEPLGLETVVSVVVGETVVKAMADPDAEYDLDSPVHLGLSADHLQVFDAGTKSSRMTARRW
jgi:multiple sugar transport system ATP-binding protein